MEMADFGNSAAATAAQNSLNQSQAFAAALQRAKQIAAKIQPNQPMANNGGGGGGVGVGGVGIGGPMGGGGIGYKRSHDDNDGSGSGPENKRFTSPDGSDYGNNSNSNSGVGGGPGNMSQALAQAAAVAARIAATASNTCEEQIRIPECLLNAFSGRNSTDTISHVQSESGCKVQINQEGDRVITLRGSRDSVTKGREFIQQLANRNGEGNVEVVLTINMPPPGPTGFPPYQEIMIPGTKVGLVIGKGGDTIKQLQEKTGAKMVIIQDGPNQEIIKPLRISGDPQKIDHAKQLVLDLIAQKDAQNQQAAGNRGGNMGGIGSNGQGGGGGGSGAGGSGGGVGGIGGGAPYNFGVNGEQCEIFVPKIAVGVVIGKGGDMIRKIQAECGCKLQFIQGKNDEPGDRRCLIQGSRQQVEDAKRTIDNLIENVLQRNRNGGNPSVGGGGPGGNGGGIGGGGGANSNNAGTDGNNSNYGYGYGVNHAQQPAREEITFLIPASKCGIVIGRGGETIKLINQQTGAYCEMDRNAVNPPSEKLFKCKGSAEQVEAARQMIAEKINMDLPIISRKPISGLPTGPQGGATAAYNANNDPNAMAAAAAYQQQWAGYAAQQSWPDQQAQSQAGLGASGASNITGQQADYSQQWIIYYKSMGMHREAEMIEQQLKAKQAAANVVVGGVGPGQGQQAATTGMTGGGAGQTADYSAQWAEYYRSIGKIDEAEAIEKQMKAAQQSNVNNMTGIGNNTGAGGMGNVSASGNGGGGGGGNNQAKDYSAQWVKYYRSVGKHEEADALEKQIKSKQGAPGMGGGNNPPVMPGGGVGGVGGGAGASGGGPASNAFPDYSQYSQYYAAAAAAAAAQGVYPQPGGMPGGGGGGGGGYGAPGVGYPGIPQAPGTENNNPGGKSEKH